MRLRKNLSGRSRPRIVSYRARESVLDDKRHQYFLPFGLAAAFIFAGFLIFGVFSTFPVAT
jgi:hypothetical protein